MKTLNIDWNDSYEVDVENPQSDIALLIDKNQKRIWIKGIELKGTEKRIKYLSQITNILVKDKIISTEKLEEVNEFTTEAESFQRFFERINKILVKSNKEPIFIPVSQKYSYYFNAKGYFQDYAII